MPTIFTNQSVYLCNSIRIIDYLYLPSTVIISSSGYQIANMLQSRTFYVKLYKLPARWAKCTEGIKFNCIASSWLSVPIMTKNNYPIHQIEWNTWNGHRRNTIVNILVSQSTKLPMLIALKSQKTAKLWNCSKCWGGCRSRQGQNV